MHSDSGTVDSVTLEKVRHSTLDGPVIASSPSFSLR